MLVDNVAAEPASTDFSILTGKEHALQAHRSAAACSHRDSSFVQAYSDTSNGLVLAAVWAFKGHHPLELTPDAIFSTIMAGVSARVNADPERFRGRFVAHEGKMTLRVDDDSLVMGPGSWDNDWERPVARLGELVMKNLSSENACRVLATRFSTTGAAQAAAHTMTFMDVVKAFFSYQMCFICGIPHIDIAGCKQDWEHLASGHWPPADRPRSGGLEPAAASHPAQVHQGVRG